MRFLHRAGNYICEAISNSLTVASSWWVAGLVLHRTDKNWVVPFLVWLAIIARLILWHVPSAYILNPIVRAWSRVVVRPSQAVPPRWSLVVAWVVLVGMIATLSMLAPSYGDNNTTNRGISLAGLALTIGLLYATSRNRKAISWYTVLVGLYLQFLIALFVLRTSVGYNIFTFISDRATDLLDFASDGLAFLTDDEVPTLSWFVISVVPPIIFFAGLAQLMSYW